MKTIILLIILLPLTGFGQIQPKKSPAKRTPLEVNTPSLQDAVSFIDITATVNKISGMALDLGVEGVKKMHPEVLLQFIDTLVANDKNVAFRRLAAKYKPQIKEIYKDLKSFGESDGSFIYTEEDPIPFKFLNAGGLAFCQHGVFSKNTYNTLKLDANQRAKSVAEEIILPGLFKFRPVLAMTGVYNLVFIVSYQVKDFSSSSSVGKDYETLAIVISKETLKNYIDAKTTDGQVFKLASWYNVTKSSGGNVKKVILN
ncbi:hypothetical protein [Hufsiella ginkgonis]|uniref:Uncharacterized protein n=1 Tax=Hufsiella ginkgonis TaxID=2695274 RepID=A0A7K1Y0R7_9SPHI|nr:hypothetical protein [Hufsiella ginkgonis]MXV16874.1 hypothetical protein [Hufsiella ginkgonis]